MKKWVKQWLGTPEGKAAEEGASFPWIPLVDEAQLHTLQQKAPASKRVIFKHSTRCGLSAMMLRRFEATWDGHRHDASFYLLDLVRYRELSDALAGRFEIRHQSPQVLIIRDGVLAASALHGDIAGLAPGDCLE